MRSKIVIAFVLVIVVQIISVIVLAILLNHKNIYIQQMEHHIGEQTAHIQELQIQLWDMKNYLSKQP